VLVGADDIARGRGVRAGQTETEAKARCPELDVRARIEAREAARRIAVAESLMAFGPEVEAQAPGFVVVELGRSRQALAGRFGEAPDDPRLGEAIVDRLAALGHRATVALADDVDTARTLAAWRARQTFAPGVEVVPSGGASAALAPLPLEALAWTEAAVDPEGRLEAKLHEACRTLATLGLERVRDLHALEGHPLPARLEEAGPLLMRRARAEAHRPLRVHRPTPRIVEGFDLDCGTDDLEPLSFIVRRLVNGVCARLDGRGESTSKLRLTWRWEPGGEDAIDDRELRPRSSKRTSTIDVELARPSREPAMLFEVLREKLEVPGFVRSVGLEALAVAPQANTQLDLFSRRPQKLEALAGLIGRLRARLGADAVFSPRAVDRHRPEASWRPAALDLERALEAPAGPRSPRRRGGEGVCAVDLDREASRALPEVDDRLSVTGGGSPETTRDASFAPPRETRPWPQPVPRRPEDEPPPLPPRPSHLAARPERLRAGPDGLGRGSETLRVIAWSGFERLETEWWTATPLRRDYWVALTDDGRKLWLFEHPEDGTYLHGWFD